MEKNILHAFILKKKIKNLPIKNLSRQKSSNLHRNFLTKCRIKFVKVKAPLWVSWSHSKEDYFTCVYIGTYF
jgi:hypothetical protein